jgi:hypothetical protein
VKTLPVTLNGLSDGDIFFMGMGLRRLNPAGLYPLPSLVMCIPWFVLYEQIGHVKNQILAKIKRHEVYGTHRFLLLKADWIH